MRGIILLAAAAIAIPFVISFVAPASSVGAAVSARFLERPGGIPREPAEAPLPINKETLRAWTTSGDTAAYAGAYAWRVIPIDLLYIIAFGGFLALGARTLAFGITPANPLGRLPALLWLVFPALYVLADLFEDILILILLTRPRSIGDLTVHLLVFLRWTKIGASALALAQLFLLGLAGAVSVNAS